MSNYLQRAEKVFARINELAAISEHETGITRTFGTPEFLRGSALVAGWMKDAGLQVYTDNIGNVRGKLFSKKPGAKTFVIASHIDTVVNAGRFDGPLGVILGLDLLEQLIADKTELPFHIELIAFSDEEGVRFHTTYLGSKVVAGSFDKSFFDRTDKAGHTLKQVVQSFGGDVNALAADDIPADEWLGYFEVHIEQGPVLYENKIPVAVVTAIAGQKRVEITFTGVAGHAGTVPMDMRNDALACAAEFVLAVESFGIENKDRLVATVGKLDLTDPASNVIPGKVVCSLDMRSPDERYLALAYQQIKDICTKISGKRKIELNWNLIQETKPATCDADLNALLKQAISNSNIDLVELVSGAGHDAVPISQVAPATMLFVRCFKGISHNPLENAELADVAAAIQVSEEFIKELIKKYE
ncbi:Zn-dependent hydrolase [Mucilaginibacter sp. PPCGB 2223]|uniref:allantoate amidohydrolase n=1 Tax=Mucilaginibacter sp. PPCGB 2223 TaxID=1886027 RepID=UPI000826D1ED|nr:allantoate amidohydrolase [Mucilaginibacter sp. PPCGB 2223]OCX54449.1 Zn-dependent hydrolase [Mucilaginibacter sp. PPCGB 2223]